LVTSAKNIDLSIIVPLYNEGECIHYLYKAIIEAIDPLSIIYEIIFVDDGSKDNTFDKIKDIAKNDSRVRVIKFRKNYGQTSAMAAGISHANGKILVTMDGDLQNDPLDIPEFMKKIDEGYDLVCGWRMNRQDKLITRKIPSIIANWIIGKVTGVPIKDNGCSLKAYRSDLIKAIPLYSEMHRFIPAMASIAGSNITEIPVRHHARKFGKTKYGLARIYKVLLDLLTIKTLVTFAARPMIWFGGMAIIALICSIFAFIFSIEYVFHSSGESIVVLLGISFLFGSLAVFLLFWGILGELVYKTGNFKLSSLADIRASIVGFDKSSGEV
jgi:glycosyltransferase involved in cell wall biosynthesis